MGDLISSIDSVAEATRDGAQKAASEDRVSDDPSPPAKPAPAAAIPAPIPSSASAFDAHLIGQSSRRRGIKAGSPMLEQAKSAYLETEFSGANERRARKGRVTRRDV